MNRPKKHIRTAALALAAMTVITGLSGCDRSQGDPKDTEIEGATMDYSDFVTEPVAANSTDSYSTLTSLFTDGGYVADTVNKNISDWLLSAYEKNPGIIDVIRDHSLNAYANSLSLGSYLNDGWKMAENGISSVAVSDPGKFGKAIAWTNHKSGNFTDIDFVFGRMPNSVLNWTGFGSLWIYADVSGYGTNDVPFGIAFEEYDTVSDGSVGTDRETWGLKAGADAVLYPDGGESSKIKTVTSSTAINDNRGRLTIPSGFKGWIKLDITPDVFGAYWSYPKSNGTLDLANVHQFTINVEGTSSSAGKTVCIGPFMLSSADTAEPPTSLYSTDFTSCCNLNSLVNGESNPNDNIVFVFYGEFPGKLLTGMSYAYKLSPSAELKAAGDELTAALADAQYEDGYLGIFDGTDRLGGLMNWDTWAQYHILFGLLEWYKTTGNTVAYDTMIKSADFIIKFFADNNRPYSYGTSMCNLGIAHAFALIYAETDDVKYLNEAEKIVADDWADCGDWLVNSEKGLEFYQMKNNFGNRWEPLHSLMTLGTLGSITGNERYTTAFENLYNSILKTDRRNTGAFSVGEEACGDMFTLANGVETCCSIAWMALTSQYLSVSGDSIAADEAELSYYNTMLASLMENCRDVTYNTQSNGTLIPAKTQLAFQARSFSPDFSCCQANSARGLCEPSSWAVLNNADRIYLNWYGESSAKLTSPGGQALTLTQKTDYPRNGNISLTIDGLATPERFTLCLRVPSWASSFTARLGDKTFTADSFGEYLPITGSWTAGMKLELEIGMTFHYLTGEGDCAGKTSVYYGPVLLAADTHYITGTALSSLSFKTSDIAAATPVTADDGVLLAFDIPTSSGETVRLISFADVGTASSEYVSWLTVDGTISKPSFERGGTPVWCGVAAE